MKKQKGITLIALIITIIVMLILVGVTVNIALNGGLFESAKNAKKDNEMHAIYELIVSASRYDTNGDINVDETYNEARKTLNSNGYTEVSTKAANGTFTVTGKNGENKYKYSITKYKIELLGLADGGGNEPDDDSSVIYALVKEEVQNGENVITDVYAGQAQACAGYINECATVALVGGQIETFPEIPTSGISDEDKNKLEVLIQKLQELVTTANEYYKNQTDENQTKALTAYQAYLEEYNNSGYENVTITNDCVINASNENTTIKSLGEHVKFACNLTIGNNITTISEGLFQNNTDLKGISFSSSVTTIDDYAFSGCTGITKIAIPTNVTTIKRYAFSGCTGLTEITIPESVTTIGDGVFSGCKGITKVSLENNTTGNFMFSGCTALETVTIPENITNMGGSEFSGCTNLKNIKIENNMISSSEFSETGITDLTIPGNVNSIGQFAFARCESLKNVVIQNGPKQISYGIIQGSYGVESITIPNSINEMDDFIADQNNSYALKNIYYNGSMNEWEQIEIDNSIKDVIWETNTTIHMSDGTTYTYDGNYQLIQK